VVAFGELAQKARFEQQIFFNAHCACFSARRTMPIRKRIIKQKIISYLKKIFNPGIGLLVYKTNHKLQSIRITFRFTGGVWLPSDKTRGKHRRPFFADNKHAAEY
jgi:hypothetical protein